MPDIRNPDGTWTLTCADCSKQATGPTIHATSNLNHLPAHPGRGRLCPVCAFGCDCTTCTAQRRPQ